MNVNCFDKVKINRVSGRMVHRTGAPACRDSCRFRPLVCRWLPSISTRTRAPPRSSGSLPPGPPHRAWEQACAWSLFTADWTTPVQWPPGSRGKPVTTASHDLKSHPAPKSVPGFPLQGHPTFLPVSLPPSPPQCLLFAICPQLDLLLQGDWGLHKGTSPDSGLLGAQGSAWQTSGAQNPSANWLVSRKLGLSAENPVKSSKPQTLLQ